MIHYGERDVTLCGSPVDVRVSPSTSGSRLVTCDHCRLLISVAEANGIEFGLTGPTYHERRHELIRIRQRLEQFLKSIL